MGLAALVITNGLQILLMTYQQGVAFSAASSLAGREILVTLPLTVLVYLPFRWVRRADLLRVSPLKGVCYEILPGKSRLVPLV